jgi:hypothetical protein
MMKRIEQVGLVEVRSDGATVWVNGSGWNVARFSEQAVEFAVSSRLKGKSGPTTHDDWILFQFDMLDVYGVRISDDHKPDFLKVPA